MGHQYLYIISVPRLADADEYKPGGHEGTIDRLMSRYKTHLGRPKLYYLRRVNKYFEIESEIKRRLKDKRFVSDKNKLLEWVTMDLSDLIKCFEDTIKFFGQDIYDPIDLSSIYEKKQEPEQDIFEVNVSDDSIHEAFIDGIGMHISELMAPSFPNEKNMKNPHLFDEDTRVLLANNFKGITFGINETQLNVMNVNKIKKKVVDNIRLRMKWLKLNEIPEYEDMWNIIIDNNKFENCMKSIVLYYNDDNIATKQLPIIFINYPFTHVRLLKMFKAIRWIEDVLKVDRFNIVNMNLDESEFKSIRIKMKNNIEMLKCLYRSKTFKMLNKIKKLNSLTRFMKFFADILNQFDNFYYYKSEVIFKDSNKFTQYINFKFNDDLIISHSPILWQKNINPEHLHRIIRHLFE